MSFYGYCIEQQGFGRGFASAHVSYCQLLAEYVCVLVIMWVWLFKGYDRLNRNSVDGCVGECLCGSDGS